MSNKFLAIIILFLGLQFKFFAQTKNEIFTIYLIRHSEKESSSFDSPLSSCGVQRSESLSAFFKDINLEAVYSTDFSRTKNTAKPTATSKDLKIKEYNPDELKDFSKLLLEKKQNALVVGHSNTTGVLAGLLVGEEFGEFDLDIYDLIYQVVICNNIAKLQIFHSAFVCKD
jgi:broad specificity phosphatase PhoE